MSIDKALAHQISEEMYLATVEIAKKYGLVIKKRVARFTDIDLKVTFKLESTSAEAKEKIEDTKKQIFELLAPSYGFDPSWFGKTFSLQGKTFQLNEIHTKKSKYPVICKCLNDGKNYKFPAPAIIIYMSK